MTIFYSDFYTTDGISRESVDRTHIADAGTADAGMRYYRKWIKALATTSDEMRMIRLHSGVRLVELYISGDDAADAGAANIGLYKSARHGGAVIDADLFADAVAKNAARVDALVEAGTVLQIDRGKYLWEIADRGAGDYDEDPQEEWDIVLTPSTSFTTTAQGFLLEAVVAVP